MEHFSTFHILDKVHLDGHSRFFHNLPQLLFHCKHHLVKLFKDVIYSKCCSACGLTKSSPICINLRNGVCVHFRELLKLIERLRDVTDSSYHISLNDIHRMHKSGPLTLVGKGLRLPCVIIVTRCRCNRITVCIYTACGGNRRNLNSFCINNSVTTICRRCIKSTEIQYIRERICKRLRILSCVIKSSHIILSPYLLLSCGLTPLK